MTLFKRHFGKTVSRRCPCGCGQILRPYTGQRPIVCYRTWQLVGERERKVLMLPGSSLAQRRAAARRVFEIALEVKREREENYAQG